jgi:hypothetical protein
MKNHKSTTHAKAASVSKHKPTVYLDLIFTISRKYRNHKRFVHPDLL